MSRPLLVLLISVLVALGPFTNNIVLPSLPAIADQFAASYGSVQLILSVYLAGFAAAQLVVGPLSDRFGRKPVLLVSLAAYAVASAACAAAPGLDILIGLRLLQAIGVSATMSVGRAIVRDMFAADRVAQIYAYVGTALALGPILGPVFGGFIEVGLGWQAVFLFVAAVGLGMLAIVAFLFGETNARRNPHAMRPAQMIGTYARLLGTRRYVGYVLCNAICYGGIFAFTSCSAYILIGLLKVTPEVFGTLYAVTVGAYGAGTLGASQLTRRFGIDRMIVCGGLVMTVFGGLLLALPLAGVFSVWSVVLPFAGFGLGTGFVFPSGQAGAIAPYPQMAGAASSMLSFLQMAAAAVTGAVTARFLDGSMMPMAWTVSLAGPAMLLGFWLLVLRRPADEAVSRRG